MHDTSGPAWTLLPVGFRDIPSSQWEGFRASWRHQGHGHGLALRVCPGDGLDSRRVRAWVVGPSSDRKGFAATERVLAPENFVSTVYAKLGIDPAKILYNQQGRPSHLVSDPTPIKELM